MFRKMLSAFGVIALVATEAHAGTFDVALTHMNVNAEAENTGITSLDSAIEEENCNLRGIEPLGFSAMQPPYESGQPIMIDMGKYFFIECGSSEAADQFRFSLISEVTINYLDGRTSRKGGISRRYTEFKELPGSSSPVGFRYLDQVYHAGPLAGIFWQADSGKKYSIEIFDIESKEKAEQELITLHKRFSKYF